MKPSWEWIEADIEDLIKNGVKEDLNLEYKECAALLRTDGKKAEASKDVSSFANSAGGTIVYGIKEDKHIPIAIDAGYDPYGDITKEWLENVLTSNIKPRIDGLRITPVQLTASNPGKVLYVVYIPQSKRPHMAADHRYYKRFNFKAEPMEDFEVWDVARRNDSPDLSLKFQLSATGEPEGLAFPYDAATPIGLYIPIRNSSPEPAFYIDVRILIDARLKVTNQAGLTFLGSAALEIGSIPQTSLGVWEMPWSIPGKMPVWEGSHFQIGPMHIQLPMPEAADYLLGWELRSPKMALKQEFCTLHWDGSRVKIILH